MLAWKSMTLGPAKHEKVARLGRISNVLGLREHKVRSNPLVSWGQNNFWPQHHNNKYISYSTFKRNPIYYTTKKYDTKVFSNCFEKSILKCFDKSIKIFRNNWFNLKNKNQKSLIRYWIEWGFVLITCCQCNTVRNFLIQIRISR